MSRSWITATALPAAGALLALPGAFAPRPATAAPLVPQEASHVPRAKPPYIWIDPSQVKNLPMSGAEWDARGAPWFQNRGVYYEAQQDTSQPLIGFLDDRTDVRVLAKALVWLRLVQEQTPLEDPEPYRAAVQQACLDARGTELLGPDQSTLALGRNLLGFVLAANLIVWDESVPGHGEGQFRAWVHEVRKEPLPDGGLVFRTMIQAHERRPNNWGLMCGASRLAAAIYLGDREDEERCWDVFRRWLGDTSSPFVFHLDDWGELSWQIDPLHPMGIDPYQATKLDCGAVLRSLDGAMPEEMRRAGPFVTAAPCDPTWSWPAYSTNDDRNYNWHAMQAVVAQAVIHARRGRDPWSVGTWAIGRAFRWLYRDLRFPVTHTDAGDDDYWMPHIANQVYPGIGIPEPLPTKPGHQLGYTDWTTLDPSWP